MDATAAHSLSVFTSRTALNFEERVRLLFPIIWRCLRRVGVPDGDLDDALQLVLLELHRRWERLSPLSDRDLRNYTYSVAIGVARDVAHARRRLAERTEPLDEAADLASDPSVDPSTALERRRALADVDAALSSLDDDAREVFVLYEVEGLTGAEVARLLRIPPGTVASRLRRAREDFQRALERRAASTQRARWHSPPHRKNADKP